MVKLRVPKKLLIILFVVFYVTINILWIAGDPNGCDIGQEVQEGCKITYPQTGIILLAPTVYFFIPITLAVVAFYSLKRKPAGKK